MAKAGKKKPKVPTLQCTICSARHEGGHGRDLCAGCLAKTASDEVRLLNGQPVCRACAGRVVMDYEGDVRCEHYCFSTAVQ